MKRRFLALLLSSVIFCSCLDFTSLAVNTLSENTSDVKEMESCDKSEDAIIEEQTEVESSMEIGSENGTNDEQSSDETNLETEDVNDSNETTDESAGDSDKFLTEVSTENNTDNEKSSDETDLETEKEDLENENRTTQENTDFSDETERAVETGFTYSISNEKVTITAYTGADAEITVPDEIEGYPVVSIGNSVFANMTTLKHVTFGDNIITLGRYAFNGCTSLESVSIGSGLESIGNSAFYNCTSLTNITMGNVTTIGSSVFYNCTALEKIIMPKSFTSVSSNTFQNSGIKKVEFEEGMTKIPNYACQNMSKLEVVEIPESVTEIGNYAFSGCTSLTNIGLGDNVVKLGSYVFNGCTSLENASWGKGLEIIGNNAFYNCTALTYISFGNVTTIGSFAFYNCTALEKITVSKSLTSISSNAFQNSGIREIQFEEGITKISNYACQNMSKLEIVEIPESVMEIGNYAFSGCTSLKNISWGTGLSVIGSNAFYSCTSLTDVTMENIETIGSSAFYNCTALMKIVMPKSLTSVGSNAFQNSGIKEVVFEEGMTKIPNYACQNMKSLEKVTIPESAAEIGNYVFNGCICLENIALHDNISVLGNNAFYGCTSLITISLGNGLNMIGSNAFYNCTSLTEIILGNVTTIGNSAFYNCIALETIVMPKNLTSVGSNVFQNSGIKKVVFEDGMVKIPNYVCQNMKALEDVIIPESVTEIGNYAFNGCSSLGSISLCENVAVLGNNAFNACSSLRTASLGDGIETIGNSAFYNCTSLIEITLGNTTAIGSSAFYNCTLLEKITIPKSLTSVGSNAFQNSGIKEVTFEEGMVKVPNYVCQNMKVLENVVLPKSATEIGDYAFNGCILLDDISLENVTKIGYYAFSGCNSFVSVTVADDTMVGNYGFGDCKALAEVVIGDNATLGAYAFRNCNKINTLRFGKGISINNTAFYNVSIKGSCGDSLTWELVIASRELYISGGGTMMDYNSESEAPWHTVSSVAEMIVFEDGITTVGAYAFKNFDNIISVVLPEETTQIGTEAFYSCDNLQYVEIPQSVLVIGERAFDGCNNLNEIIFCGDAPTLRNDCLPNTDAVTVHYPETASGWTERILSRYGLLIWQKWDNTVPSSDAVLLLDISGSMSNRMDELKESAIAFIGGLGGRLSNTRVAVVAYDSSAKTVTTFSTDRYYQSRQINMLESDGGTAYIAALNSASSLLETSNTDFKSIILFSDGEPNDSKTEIYSLSEKLRESYEIYTVGLLSSASQRNVLVNVAGGEDNYFEASDVEELLQTFLNLVDNFGKSTETTVEIKRHDSRYDLLAEKQTLCVGSKELVSIIVTPGTKYGNVAKIALVQNGTAVLENTTGEFNLITPGDLFKEGQDVYSVLYDTEGKEIESLTLKIDMRASYTITYKLNYGENAVYKMEQVVGGETIQKPDDPVREGYRFRGWYSTESCTGISYFSIFNTINRSKLEGDITLYAKWSGIKTTLDLPVDAFKFNNSATHFCVSSYYDDLESLSTEKQKEQYRKQYKYEISEGDYAQLISGLHWYNPIQKSRVKSAKNDSWGGSCFGMSSVVALAKDRALDISNFDANYTEIGQIDRLLMNTKGNADVGNVESLINYYHLMQNIGKIYDIRNNYSNSNESKNLENIVNKFKQTDCVAVVTINLREGNKNLGGHAVVGYDFIEDKENNTYAFSVYDCSIGNKKFYPVTITKSGNTYSAECSEWEADWYSSKFPVDNIFFKAIVTVDEFENEVLLTAPSVTRGRSVNSNQNSAIYDLYTSFSDFEITDGNKYAEVRNGELVDGNTLQLECFGAVNEIGQPSEYFYRLPSLGSGLSYEITPTNKDEGSYTTMVYYNHSENGFFVSETAETAGVITLSNKGVVKTEYGETVDQEIHVSNNQMETPWYYINLEGEGNSFTIEAQSDKTTITSESAAKVDITAEDDFNVYHLDQVDVSRDGISIISDNDRNCIIESSDGKQTIIGQFGYSVVFDSQQGTYVNSLTGVEKDSLIDEPDDPRREGYIFEGWFKESNCKNAWNFKTDKIMDNTILYAGWSLDANYFTGITFRAAGMEDQILYLPKNSLIDVDSCPVLSEEFEYQGWYLDQKYSRKWDFEKDIVTKDIILYAKGKSCTVTFVTNCDTKIGPRTVYVSGK